MPLSRRGVRFLMPDNPFIDPDEALVPELYPLDPNDSRASLRENLIEALRALPHYFTSPINIEGLIATDPFSMNTLLGGAIEEQTVRILNSLRTTWDPEDRWVDREFMRFPESFPDVRLVKSIGNPEPVIGVELKGWYLLSKEKEPSFRFLAAADATTEFDLIVCVPWALSNVLSGNPVVYDPYIEQAKYAADMRTHYWHHRSGNAGNRVNAIRHPDTLPYPRAGSAYVDVPVQDGGGNFGRIARVPGLMKEWIEETSYTKLAGIEARYWVDFLLAFKEGSTRKEIERAIELIDQKVQSQRNKMPPDTRRQVLDCVYQIVELIGE